MPDSARQGWTSIVLGELGPGRKAIHDGLRLAKDVHEWYLCAKACRHLASVARQKRDWATCERWLTEAQEFTAKVTDPLRTDEMTTSLLVSRAKLLSAQGTPAKAVELLVQARDQYRSCGDPLREVKIFHPLGVAQHSLGQRAIAVATFHEGYEFALKCGRKNEALTNAIEATIVLADDGQHDVAKKWAALALRLSVDLSDYPIPRRVAELAGNMLKLGGD